MEISNSRYVFIAIGNPQEIQEIGVPEISMHKLLNTSKWQRKQIWGGNDRHLWGTILQFKETQIWRDITSRSTQHSIVGTALILCEICQTFGLYSRREITWQFSLWNGSLGFTTQFGKFHILDNLMVLIFQVVVSGICKFSANNSYIAILVSTTFLHAFWCPTQRVTTLVPHEDE